MSRGSPGARNTHAGKYGELTPSRQRGGGGWKTPATALPAQNSDDVLLNAPSLAAFVSVEFGPNGEMVADLMSLLD